MNFFIIANNGREAASIARQKPGVKSNHHDAILSVTEISKESFFIIRNITVNDLFFNKKKMGNKSNMALFFDRLEPETEPYIILSEKKAARKYRYRRIRAHERSLHDEIIREYGIAI